MVMKKDRYTEKAWEVMGTSEAMVRTLRHNQLDVEHLVLAMLQQQDGPVPQIMELLGADTPSLSNKFLQALTKTPTVAYPSQTIYITPRFSMLQDRAAAEMDRLRD